MIGGVRIIHIGGSTEDFRCEGAAIVFIKLGDNKNRCNGRLLVYTSEDDDDNT